MQESMSDLLDEFTSDVMLPRPGSSIIAQAGGDPVQEHILVEQTLLRIAAAKLHHERRLAVAKWAEARAKAYRQQQEEEQEGRLKHLEGLLFDWRKERGEPGKSTRSYVLPSGSVGLRKVPARYEVNEDAVLRLGETDASLYGDGCLTIVIKVNKDAVLKRFKGDGSQVVDTMTGEVVEPVSHWTQDGQEVTSPVLTLVEPERDVLSYKTAPLGALEVLINGRGDTGEGEADAGS